MNIPKRRYRWLFSGKDANGEIIFPECIVNAIPRNNIPNDGSGEMEIAQYHSKYDNFYQAKDAITKECDLSNSRFADVAIIHLKLVAGGGMMIEEWVFQDVCMKPLSQIPKAENNYIVATWNIAYKRINYYTALSTKNNNLIIN